MSEAAACTHRMPSGHACQSPAVKGTALCYHHTALKGITSQAAEPKRLPNGGWQPLPFVFPEDRAALQMNYFALLRAFNAQAIDLRTFNAMHRVLRSMAANLGKTSLTQEPAAEAAPSNASENPPSPSEQSKSEEPTPPQPVVLHASSESDPANPPLASLVAAQPQASKLLSAEQHGERHRLARELYFGGKARRT